MYEGREDREFGAASDRHKKQTGGPSNREKEKKKNLPLAARMHKVRLSSRDDGCFPPHILNPKPYTLNPDP